MKRKFFSFLMVILLFSSFLSSAHAEFKKPVTQAKIFARIPFAKAGSFDEFENTMKQTREQVRQQLEAEFMSMMQPLAENADDMTGLAMAIAKIIMMFDDVYTKHREEALIGMDKSLEAIFKAHYDTLATNNDFSEPLRLARFIDVNPKKMTAYELAKSVDYILYGTYTIAENSTIILTLTLEDILTGVTQNFNSKGKPEFAIRSASKQLFDFFQGNNYGEWINPQPHLSFFKAPGEMERMSAAKAQLFCKSQKGRLPFTSELVQAALGGDYRKGGITIDADEYYAVSDRQRIDRPYFYRENFSDVTGGPVRNETAGPISSLVWCVKGEPSAEIVLTQQLYRQIRLAKAKSLPVKTIAALEYILIQLNDLGARYDLYGESFFSYEEARDYLKTQKILVPEII